eukprot:Phypoly_transcript_02965.p2 GENE.Phypoly_transcript_02965~~Phypoly_transcript_02965.p2  ORF type:complete len:305 (+),score=-12.16 Phypoly_transcript_02965:77-991(+)
MKKRYGLESIIGKNSSLRFPRLVSIEDITTINSILPANSEEIESSFNTALTMKNADPEEACDQFNNISCEYDDEFPIRVKVIIQGSISSIEVLDPSIFSLICMAFDITESPIEKFRASISDILITLTNFAFIKNPPDESYFVSDLVANTRTLLNNIMSYNCRRKRIKQSNILNIKPRLKPYLLNIKSHINKQYYHKRLYHFCYKALKYQRKDLIPLLFERIEYFYDVFEDWEDAYDFAWFDQQLLFIDNLLELSLLAGKFTSLTNVLDNKLLTPIDALHQHSLYKIAENFASTTKFDLLDSFKM